MKKSVHNYIVFLMFLGLVSCNSGNKENTDTVLEVDEVVEVVDPLSSWNDGAVKKAITEYVEDVTNPKSVNFIPVSSRIATFDNDGTLWSEQPIYFQLFFALDRVKDLADDRPEWKNQQPFKAVLENNMEELLKQGEKGLVQIMMETHAGNTTDEFESIVKNWIATAKHPSKDKLFTDLVFQPMLELLQYLRNNDFKIFIVSGGGIEFMRPWVEEVYGIPKDQVVGSSIKTEYDYNDGSPVLKRLAEIDLIDDKEGKPVGINRYIGRKPVFSVGNSDGDLQMLRWADANKLKSFKLYVHHTDSVREWAYDRKSHVGGFDKGLDEANEKGWSMVDMAKDWKVIYPFEKE
ncbi:HAD family hydrolase [Mangrovimonas aestuarii]|uniref:HAD family hydrolase n=1 Tax=Mangrovimonas aestuarii TaxID=3018443 RepID=UPI00237832DF|nr:HAD family hydrolase [Mangrovimonas aestuarii]